MRPFKTIIGAFLAAGLLAQGAAAQSANKAAELPATSMVQPNGVMLLIPDRTLTISGGLTEKPILVSEAAAGPNPIAPIQADPQKEKWGTVQGSPVMPAAGQLSFSMWVSDKDGTVVRLLNGTETPVIYIAHLIRRDQGVLKIAPTTICATKAGGWAVEHWPYKIEAVQITGMGKVSADTCYDAAAKSAYKMGEQPPSSAPKPAQ